MVTPVGLCGKSGLSRWCSDKESAGQCRRHKSCDFHPWVRKIPWRKKTATSSRILAWKISWTEEPGGLQATGSQRVRHDWATESRVSNPMLVSGEGRAHRGSGFQMWTYDEKSDILFQKTMKHWRGKVNWDHIFTWEHQSKSENQRPWYRCH